MDKKADSGIELSDGAESKTHEIKVTI